MGVKLQKPHFGGERRVDPRCNVFLLSTRTCQLQNIKCTAILPMFGSMWSRKRALRISLGLHSTHPHLARITLLPHATVSCYTQSASRSVVHHAPARPTSFIALRFAASRRCVIEAATAAEQQTALSLG